MTDENTIETEDLENSESAEQASELESMEDSMQAVLAELEGEEDGEELQADGELPGSEGAEAKNLPPRDQTGKFTKARKGKRVVEAAELEPVNGRGVVASVESQTPQTFEPPARWTVEAKEWFKTQPPEAQREYLNTTHQLERHGNKLYQDLNREIGKHSSINSILEHYADEWHEEGFTVPQMIAELAASRKNIKLKPVETLSKIMDFRGVTLEQLAQYRNGNGHHTAAPAPQQNVLTRDDIPVLLKQFQQNLQNSQAQAQSYSEFQQVLNEAGPDGRYSYPELWNPEYLSRVRPLVDDLRKTQPGVGYGLALKRAVNVLRQLDGTPTNGSPSPNGQRLSREQEIARAKAANGSVRGRGNALIPTQAAPKLNESLEDSFAAIHAELNSR